MYMSLKLRLRKTNFVVYNNNNNNNNNNNKALIGPYWCCQSNVH